MNLFSTSSAELENQFANARLNPLQPADLSASWYEGMGTGIVSGLQTARARELFVSTADEEKQKAAAQQIKSYKPDPRTVGLAGQLLYGLADTLTVAGAEFATGNIAPTSLAMSITDIYSRTQKEVNILEGMDPKTAAEVASFEGIGAGLGIVAPAAVPGRLALRALSGAGINTALGVGQRVGISETLKGAGYADMAKQYAPFDGASVLTDAAIGAFFGGALGPRAGKPAPRVKPSDLDVGLTMNNAAHIETGVAPGIPTDVATRNAHVESVNQAIESLVRGDPVQVADGVVNGQFIENPSAVSMRNQVVSIIDEHMGSDWAALKAELDKRGLTSEDLDTSPPVRMVQATPGEQLPGAIMGAESRIKIEGQPYPVRWALVDAGQIEATMNKAENQFRDRTRAASQAQISKIAQSPDYELLIDSPLMDFGAPTMTKEGVIVGGNGRFAGVSKAYEIGTSAKYSKPLLENLRRYGIDPESANGMKKPVLVRVLQSEIDVKRAAIASNEGAGLGMSPLEQAKVDSERLGDITGLQINENGEVSLAQNSSYIRRWATQFPDSEIGKLVNKAGGLSLEGEKRFRNALLFRAVGDSPTLERLIESNDPGVRNVATALQRIAPRAAEVKAAIQSGDLYPLDISADISAAVEKLNALREAREKVKDYLQQNEMFGAELSPEARILLEQFDKNMRSAKTMTEIINGYYDKVEQAGSPKQADMLGGGMPSKESLLRQSIIDANPAGERLQKRVDTEFNKLVSEYDKIPETKGGRVINTDEARELSPEYRADRSLAAAVQDAASAFTKRLFAEKLSKPTPAGLEPAVLFLGGGGGSGKSTGLELMGPNVDKFEMIYDTTLASRTGEKQIQAALDAGRDVSIVYTFRDPVESFGAALERAMRMEKTNGSGRTVPLEIIAADHRDARANIDKLAAKYANDPRVTILAIDNSRGPGNATIVDVAKIPTVNYNGIEAKFYEILQKSYENREISDAVYYGTLDSYRPEQQINGANGGRGPGEIPQQRAQGDAAGSEKAVASSQVDQALTDRPDLKIASEDGHTILAGDALAQADAEIARAQIDSQGFDAAAACALRG